MGKCGDQPLIGLFVLISLPGGQCIDQGQLYQQGGGNLSLGCWSHKPIVRFWQRLCYQEELVILHCFPLILCCL
jgi:hypothetical protein